MVFIRERGIISDIAGIMRQDKRRSRLRRNGAYGEPEGSRRPPGIEQDTDPEGQDLVEEGAAYCLFSGICRHAGLPALEMQIWKFMYLMKILILQK